MKAAFKNIYMFAAHLERVWYMLYMQYMANGIYCHTHTHTHTYIYVKQKSKFQFKNENQVWNSPLLRFPGSSCVWMLDVKIQKLYKNLLID